MTSPPTPPARRATECPLCGGPNRCGIARGEAACWCFSTAVSPAALAAVPTGERDVCVCRACAQPTRTFTPPSRM